MYNPLLFNKKNILFFVCWTFFSIFAAFNIEPFINYGDQLLQNSDFSQEFSSWKLSNSSIGKVEIGNSKVMLAIDKPGNSIYLDQSLKTDELGKAVILGASVKSENIIAGPKGWNKGRIVLVQYIQGKPRYSLSHVLVALEGTNPWKIYRKVFYIHPLATEIKVVLQLSNCTGELYCKDLSLFRAVVNPVYRVVKWLVLGGWLVFVLLLFGPVLRSVFLRGRLAGGLVVLTLGAILFGTMMPGTLKNDLKHDLVREVRVVTVAVSGTDLAEIKKLVDITKVAHFFLFMVLAVLLLRQSPRRGKWQVLGDLLMLAVATELAQLFIEGRSALAADVGIDLAGGILGVLGARN